MLVSFVSHVPGACRRSCQLFPVLTDSAAAIAYREPHQVLTDVGDNCFRCSPIESVAALAIPRALPGANLLLASFVSHVPGACRRSCQLFPVLTDSVAALAYREPHQVLTDGGGNCFRCSPTRLRR